MRKDWAEVPAIKKWIAIRKIEGKPLRDVVWKELEPLRKALINHAHNHRVWENNHDH